jgi:SEC-C motif
VHAKEQIQPCSPSVQRDPGSVALLILSLGAIIGRPGVRLDARLRRYYTSGGGSERQDWPRWDRNAPCPCGSGRKYKKCCAWRDATARAEANPPPLAEEEFTAELKPELDAEVDQNVGLSAISSSRSSRSSSTSPVTTEPVRISANTGRDQKAGSPALASGSPETRRRNRHAAFRWHNSAFAE